MEQDSISIEVLPTNGVKWVVRILQGHNVLDLDSVNRDDMKKRNAYLSRIVDKFPSIDREALEDELLNGSDRRVDGSPTTYQDEVPDCDIDRPERIIRPKLSSIAIPVRAKRNDELVPQWIVYSSSRRNGDNA